MIESMDLYALFHGPNAGYVLELWERYRQDPQAVDAQTRRIFERWTPNGGTAAGPAIVAQPDLSSALHQAAAATDLAQAVRHFGHLQAQLDPLGSPPPGDIWLRPEFHGISAADLSGLPATLIGGPVAERSENALQAIQELRRIYSNHIGHDSIQVRVPQEREWLRHAAESGQFSDQKQPFDRIALLGSLTRVEVFEQFLHRRFPGKTRFSIEGLDMLVPMLEEIIRGAGEQEVRSVFLNMAHRGRLNVMAHILGVPYRQILAQFKDPVSSVRFHYDLGWMGDVKYHAGATLGEEDLEDYDNLRLSMTPNPSHLEAVDPVLEGMARAAGTDAGQPGPGSFDPSITLPVLIHGDASFPGQGVVAETLNLGRIPGYTTGGTIHIIANNQLGFTTLPEEGRSTMFASDLAKGFRVPIVHVNADDPQACIEAARMALAYRFAFQKSFVIDLIGYRRYGHNEGDEPSFTQPLMYKIIEDHPSVRAQWAEKLVAAGAVDPELPDRLVQEHMDRMKNELEQVDLEEDLVEPKPIVAPKGAARRVQTAVPAALLRELNSALVRLPPGFTAHPKIARMLKRRQQMPEDDEQVSIDWTTAEQLAFASILAEGIPVRLTGEDVERGTFSQRHAVFHDYGTGETYVPIREIPQARAAFEIHNSPLTENATLGFEYGYNIQAAERLVIWEAQYGDFINGAQVVVDEFITSARMKWDHAPSLVLLLPHGSEGAGPDHSTGRLSRFLSLAAKTNLRIAVPTTAAQYFHLLRRQALLLKTDPLPLIAMTPKSLLRHPLTSSALSELSGGQWQPVIEDVDAFQRVDQIRRVLLCSGKIYVDLVTSPLRSEHPEIAIIRLEQLYRFPAELVEQALARFPKLEQVFWVQEEPKNMGGWTFVSPRLEKIIAGRWAFRMVGRYSNASPAEGSASMYQHHQQIIIDFAFDSGVSG